MRLGTGREPIFTYRMAPRDLARLRRSITILAEMAFAGGAREVYLPIFGTTAVDSLDKVEKLERSPWTRGASNALRSTRWVARAWPPRRAEVWSIRAARARGRRSRMLRMGRSFRRASA